MDQPLAITEIDEPETETVIRRPPTTSVTEEVTTVPVALAVSSDPEQLSTEALTVLTRSTVMDSNRPEPEVPHSVTTTTELAEPITTVGQKGHEERTNFQTEVAIEVLDHRSST